MTTLKRVVYLLLTLGAILYAPYIASYYNHDGKFPEGSFHFPPVEPLPKSGLNLTTCAITAVLFFVILLLLFIPKIFGFTKCDTKEVKKTSEKVALPLWFWIGLVMWGITLLALVAKWSEPKWLLNWAVLPLFWGFTLLLDGWVYVRNNGKSIVSVEPRELIAIGVVSISGWLIFEYLNFFIKFNWYYPQAGLITHDRFLLYATLGSSGLMPMAFEWYHLLRTFSFFRNKYTCGPKTSFSGKFKTLLLILSFIGLAAAAYFPDHLFFILWVAPLIILTVVLEKVGIWTPFIPVKQGDWSPLLLFSLTYLIQGFLLECWNYFSGQYIDGKVVTHNPAYWAYSVPFVNRWHVFEMPILGYLGYIPFGVYCWIWWIAVSYLLDISKNFTFSMDFR